MYMKYFLNLVLIIHKNYLSDNKYLMDVLNVHELDGTARIVLIATTIGAVCARINFGTGVQNDHGIRVWIRVNNHFHIPSVKKDQLLLFQIYPLKLTPRR